MRPRRLLVVPLACALALAGCGSGHHTTTTVAKPTPAPRVGQACAVGSGHMGCATAPPAPNTHALTFAASAGCKIPDDYEGNGTVNYAAARPFICGAIIKAGEGDFHLDSTFSTRLAQLRALHIWHAPYWFVRPESCTAEASLIISTIQRNGGLDSGPLILDAEVPGAAAMVPCLEARTSAAFHRPDIVYTAPGTWGGTAADGDGLGAWIATYGSSRGCLPWTCSFVAWQCSDGRFGCVTRIPGLPTGDMSVDLGITKLVPKPKPPADPHGYLLLSPVERAWVIRYDGARQHPAKYARYLNRTLEPELANLADAIYRAAHRHRPPNWGWIVKGDGTGTRGQRYQALDRRAHGQEIVR